MKRAFLETLHFLLHTLLSSCDWHYLDFPTLMAKLAFFFIDGDAVSEFIVCRAKLRVDIPAFLDALLKLPMVPFWRIRETASFIHLPLVAIDISQYPFVIGSSTIFHADVGKI